MTANFSTEDSEDLEALFDSIVGANREADVQPDSAGAEFNSPLSAPRPTEGRASDETTSQSTDETPSHSTRSPKDVDQVAGYRLANNANQIAGYGGVPFTGVRSDLSADREQRTPLSQSPVLTAQSADVINQIGLMTRTLHDALRELGLNKKIEKAASSIPDARDRLNYVATLTQQAAERVLSATEAAQPLVEKMEVEAHRLSGQWQMLFEKQLDVEQFKDMAMQTHAFLLEVPKQTKATHAYLMEIMMAQDFQDLTGQVIKKIIEVTENMEQQLLALLVENAPALRKNPGQASARADLNAGMLNGPVIQPNGRRDIVSNQNQVDDLLESLGF